MVKLRKANRDNGCWSRQRMWPAIALLAALALLSAGGGALPALAQDSGSWTYLDLPGLPQPQKIWWVGNFEGDQFLILAEDDKDPNAGTFYKVSLSQIGNGVFYPGLSVGSKYSSLHQGEEIGIRQGPGEALAKNTDVFIHSSIVPLEFQKVDDMATDTWIFDRQSSMLWKGEASTPLNWGIFSSAKKVWEKNLDLLKFPSLVAIAVADLVGDDDVDDLVAGVKGESANYIYLMPGGGSDNFLTPAVLSEDLTRRALFATKASDMFPTVLDAKFSTIVLKYYEGSTVDNLAGNLDGGKVPDKIRQDLADIGVPLYEPLVVTCPTKTEYPDFLKRWYDAVPEEVKLFSFSVQDKQRMKQIVEALNTGTIPAELSDAFHNNGSSLSDQASVEKAGEEWQITDRGGVFTIRKEKDGTLNIYEIYKEKCKYWLIVDGKGYEYVIMRDYKITAESEGKESEGKGSEWKDILRVLRKPVFDLIFAHELKIHIYPVDPYTKGSLPTMILLKDVTGDDSRDIVVAERQTYYRAGGVLVLANKGYGAFEEAWENKGIFPGESLSEDDPRLVMCVADFDGDGKDDLALAGNSDLAYLKGSENGKFTILSQLQNAVHNPRKIMAWDGALVVLNEGDVTIWNVETPNGGFEFSRTLTELGASLTMCLKDLTGDGLKDLALLTVYDDTMKIAIHKNRAGQLVEPRWRPRGKMAALGGATLGGDLDALVIARAIDANEREFEMRTIGAETTKLTAQSFQKEQHAYPASIVFAEGVENDSKRPRTLIIPNFGTNSLSWLSPENADFSKGKWEEVKITDADNSNVEVAPQGVAYYSPSPQESYLAIVDHQEEGRLLIFKPTRKSYGQKNVQLTEVNKNENWRFSTGAWPISVVSGVFAAGDPPDSGLAVLNQGDETVVIYRKNTAYLGPDYEKIPPLEKVGTYPVDALPVAMCAGQLNDDEVTDLVVANYANNSVTILLSQKDGTFASQTVTTGGVGPIAVAIGPFAKLYGGEGSRNDIVVANYVSSDLSILQNTGSGFELIELTSDTTESDIIHELVDEGGTTKLVTRNDLQVKDGRLFVPYGPVALTTGEFTEKGQLDLVIGVEYPEVGKLGLFLITGGPVSSSAVSTSHSGSEPIVIEPPLAASRKVLNVFEVSSIEQEVPQLGIVVADVLKDGGLELHLYLGECEKQGLSIVADATYPCKDLSPPVSVAAADIDMDGNTDLIISAIKSKSSELRIRWGPDFASEFSTSQPLSQTLLAWPGHVLIGYKVMAWTARDNYAEYALPLDGVPIKAATYLQNDGIYRLAIATHLGEDNSDQIATFLLNTISDESTPIWKKNLAGEVTDLTWVPATSEQTPSLAVANSASANIALFDGVSGDQKTAISFPAVAVNTIVDEDHVGVLVLNRVGELYLLSKTMGKDNWEIHPFHSVRMMEANSLRILDINHDRRLDVVAFKPGGNCVHVLFNARSGPNKQLELSKNTQKMAVIFQYVTDIRELWGSFVGSSTVIGEPIPEKKVSKGNEEKLVVKREVLTCNPTSLIPTSWPPVEDDAHILSAISREGNQVALVKGRVVALFGRASGGAAPLALRDALTLDATPSALVAMTNKGENWWALLMDSSVVLVKALGNGNLYGCEFNLPLPGKSIAVGDFLGTGEDQLAVSYAQSPRIDILIKDAQGNFDVRTYELPFSISDMRAADINADGRKELVAVGDHRDEVYSVSFSGGNGAPNICGITLKRTVTKGDLLVGDLTGDGCDDVMLFSIDKTTDTVRAITLFGRTDGRLLPSGDSVVVEGWGLQKAMLVDSTQDGIADHLMIITERWPLVILYPLENGLVSSVTPLALVPAPSAELSGELDPQAIVAVNIDGDTWMDVIVITIDGNGYVAWGKKVWFKQGITSYIELTAKAWDGRYL